MVGKKTKLQKKIKRHILVNVSSYDEKGLVGYTETGEEIPLSAPVPRILKITKGFPGEPIKNCFLDNDDSYWEDILVDAKPALRILKALNEVYFQFEDSYSVDEFIDKSRPIEIPYNIYTKRVSAL